MSEIDFVVTWVDSAVPELARARKQAKAELGRTKGSSGSQDNGEIYYLIASIIKYAPFVRYIHIVTDNQKPLLLDDFVASGLCRPDLIRLVSHDVIFEGLDVPRPTFNSRVIEAAIWRIPGLAEQFVYCNDDMFLNAPLTEEDFFRNGKPVIRGTVMLPDAWRPRFYRDKLMAYLRGRPAPDHPLHSRAQEQGAKLAGMNGLFLLPHHNPHPMRRSTAEAFYAERPDVLSAQMQHRFRDSSQYLQVSLSNHLERRRHGAKFKFRRSIAYLRPNSSAAALKRNLTAIRNATVPFGCIQSLEGFSSEAQAQIHATLQEKFSAELPPDLLQAA